MRKCNKCGGEIESQYFSTGNPPAVETWTVCINCHTRAFPTLQAEIPAPTGQYTYEIKIRLFNSETGEVLAIETFEEQADNREDIDVEGLAKAFAWEMGWDMDEDDIDFEDELIDVH